MFRHKGQGIPISPFLLLQRITGSIVKSNNLFLKQSRHFTLRVTDTGGILVPTFLSSSIDVSGNVYSQYKHPPRSSVLSPMDFSKSTCLSGAESHPKVGLFG